MNDDQMEWIRKKLPGAFYINEVVSKDDIESMLEEIRSRRYREDKWHVCCWAAMRQGDRHRCASCCGCRKSIASMKL